MIPFKIFIKFKKNHGARFLEITWVVSTEAGMLTCGAKNKLNQGKEKIPKGRNYVIICTKYLSVNFTHILH